MSSIVNFPKCKDFFSFALIRRSLKTYLLNSLSPSSYKHAFSGSCLAKIEDLCIFHCFLMTVVSRLRYDSQNKINFIQDFPLDCAVDEYICVHSFRYIFYTTSIIA